MNCCGATSTTGGSRAFAIVDITSDIAHVIGKVGLWSTQEIVYVSEAVFDSVTKPLLSGAKAAILGGKALKQEEVEAIQAEVQAKAKRG